MCERVLILCVCTFLRLPCKMNALPCPLRVKMCERAQILGVSTFLKVALQNLRSALPSPPPLVSVGRINMMQAVW